MKKLIVLLSLFLLAINGYSQCLQVQSILVDACNSTSLEPNNEMVRFKNGSNPLNISQISISCAPASGVFTNNVWTTVSVSWNGLIQNASTASATAALQATITNNCGKLIEPPAGIIPPNAYVLMITSTGPSSTDNTFANLMDTLYVVYHNALYTGTTGHFGNGSSSGTRDFCLIDNSTGCRDTVRYDCGLLVGGNGATVEYAENGTATYVNNGCQAPILPFSVNAGNNQSGCANATFNLNATPNGQYSSVTWSGGTGTFGSPNSLSTTYTPGAGESGTVNLTVTLHRLCGTTTTSDNVTLTLTAAPVPVITSSAGNTVCQGDSVQLTASNGSSYVWNPGAISANSIFVSAAGTYTLSSTTACGTTSSTFTLNVNALPNVSVTANDSSICSGTTITLDGSGANNYSWSAGTSAPTGITVTATPASSTSYTLTGTDGNGCEDTASVYITVNTSPVISSSATLTQPDCGASNGSITGLSVTGSGNYTYSWANSSSVVSIVADATGLDADSYTVTVTDAVTLCSGVQSFTLTGIGGPLTPVFSSIPTVCEGSTFTLTIDASSTTPGATYNWTSGVNLVQSGVDLISLVVDSATAANAGPYTVEVVSGGCDASTTVSATFNPRPVPAITGNLNFCPGANTVLDASASSPSGVTFQWYEAGNPISGANSATYTVTTAGSYQVLISGNGCDSLSNASTVTVNALPVVNTATPPVTITNTACGLNTGSITGANASGAQPIGYSWTNGGGTSFANDTLLTGAGAGTYYLVATDANGCMDSAQFVVNADPAPAAPAFAAAGTVCEGSTFTLTVTNPEAGASYSWAATGLSTQTGIDLTSITVTDADAVNVGPYTVSVTVGGCSNSATVSATLHNLPNPQITSAATSYCAGDSLILNGSPVTGVTWQWYFNGNPLSNATGADHYATQAGDYQLLVNDGTCDSISTILTVSENTLPSVSATNISACLNTTPSITAFGAQSYSWSAGTTPSTGATVSVAATTVGVSTYTVTGTDNNGCSDTASVQVTVNANPVITINSIQNDTITSCEGVATSLTAAGAQSYVWSTNEIINPISFSSTTNTVVSVVGTDNNGCIDSTRIIYAVNPAPAVPVTSGAASICNGYPTTLYVDTIPGQTYSWSAITGVLSTADSVVISAVGSYSLTVTNSCGTFVMPINVIASSINASFVADTTMGVAPLAVSFANTSSNANNYYWDLGNGITSTLTTPSATVYNQPGTYTAYLLASNTDFCYMSYTVDIIVLEMNVYLTIPNVFSPNNDGLNDYFGVKHYGIKEFTCDIFNRWGTQVSGMDSVDDKWTPAENVSEGTYFYIVKAKGIDGKEYSVQGYVLLAR